MGQEHEMRRGKVIEVLNIARSRELMAIYQYMNQHYSLDKLDYGELAKQIKLIAIDEMRHAEQFAERIKELNGGAPTTEPVAKATVEQQVHEMFPFDSGLENDTIHAYNDFARICLENGDSQTMELFEDIIGEEQEHLNYFDNVHDHIQGLGASYLATIAGTSSSTGGYSKGFVKSKSIAAT